MHAQRDRDVRCFSKCSMLGRIVALAEMIHTVTEDVEKRLVKEGTELTRDKSVALTSIE